MADLAFAALAVLTLGYIPLAAGLVGPTRAKPSIWALTLFTLLVAIIATYVVAYVLAVANSFVGYPVPRELVIALLRLLLLPLAAFPYLFVWVLRTGRFRDGGK